MTTRQNRESDLEAFTSDLAPPIRRGKGLGGMIGTMPPATIERGDDTTLSPSEVDALNQYEVVIERGLKTFFEVGHALLCIRDQELYRAEHRTFEAYCQERWSISRPRAYELMHASQVVSAIADISVERGEVEVPQNEAQARPLTRLKDPERQRQAWQAVIERAQELGQRITAALVEAVVRELQAAAEPIAAAPAQSVEADEAAQPDDGAVPDDSAQEPNDAAEPDEAQEPDAWAFADEAAAPALPADLGDDLGDNASEAGEEPPPDELDYPDDLERLTAMLQEQGYEQTGESEARLTFEQPDGGATVSIVKPPMPNELRVRIVAHRDTDWSDVAERLAQVGIELDRPRPGHLPKYPETQRAYGTLDLNAEVLDETAALRAENVRKDESLVQKNAEIAELMRQNQSLYRRLAESGGAALHERADGLQRRLDTALSIIEEHREGIERAQQFKPTSTRGEAVEPLLRAIERVGILLREGRRK